MEGAGGRDAALDVIYAELGVFARRVRGRVRELHPDLSFVAHTLLAHVRAAGGCRAADLVRVYGLEKSTVSRQVAALEGRGLLERVYDPEDRRIQTLRLTAAGAEQLARADRALHAVLQDGLAGWGDDDVARLAVLLRRFNADVA